jgi:uncharacterized protein YukE
VIRVDPALLRAAAGNLEVAESSLPNAQATIRRVVGNLKGAVPSDGDIGGAADEFAIWAEECGALDTSLRGFKGMLRDVADQFAGCDGGIAGGISQAMGQGD